jgi:hypothetical protein
VTRILAAILLLAGMAPAAVPTIGTKELSPGMKGYGLSVFFGQQVERFEAEVIDVIHNEWPRGDMILCRLSGKGLEESGIVAGMSGSPVYFDGRLAGAVAYGWGFSKQPIAGVTPIEQMRETWRDEDKGSGARGQGPGIRGQGTGNREGELRTLAVPLAVSGMTPRAAAAIESLVGGWGLKPVVAGSGAGIDSSDAALAPGSAVGVALVDGDVRFSAIGTLTDRDGDRILMFGHPMFQGGGVVMPFIAGWIHTVLPSAASSFKIFSPGPVVGATREDRLYAVSARLGERANTLPVTVRLQSPTVRDVFRFNVALHDDVTPALLPAAVAEVIYESEGSMVEQTMRVRYVLRAGRDSVEVRHVAAGPDPAAAWLTRLRDELRLLYANRFERPALGPVDVSVEFEPGVSRAFLSGVRPERQSVRAGESLRLFLALRDWRGASFEDTVELNLPEALPPGKLVLRLGQRDSLLLDEAGRSPGKLEPRSLAGVFELLGRTGREDELRVTGTVRVPGLVLGSEELAAPPRSVRSVLQGGVAEGIAAPTPESQVLEKSFALDRVIAGTARLELEVIE